MRFLGRSAYYRRWDDTNAQVRGRPGVRRVKRSEHRQWMKEYREEMRMSRKCCKDDNDSEVSDKEKLIAVAAVLNSMGVCQDSDGDLILKDGKGYVYFERPSDLEEGDIKTGTWIEAEW